MGQLEGVVSYIFCMKGFLRALVGLALVAGGVAVDVAMPSGASAAARRCKFADFDQFTITAKPNTPGLQTVLITHMTNVSPSTCSISCRAAIVSARVIVAKAGGDVVADISPAGVECPPDPNTDDGVAHIEVRPKARYTVALQWNQRMCTTPTTCKPAAPGQYRVQVGWSVFGGSQIKTAYVTVGKGTVCPKTVNDASLLLPRCVGVTKTPPLPRALPPQTTMPS
jgi:hypothetical protein